MKKKSSPKKGRKGFSPFKILVLVPLLLFLLLGGWFVFLSPRQVWLVEERFAEAWEKILVGSPSLGQVRTILIPPAGTPKLPQRYYGYRIGSGDWPDNITENNSPFQTYRDLFRSAQYEDSLVLALDPWMVFRKYWDPELSRGRVLDPSGGDGDLLAAGRDPAVVWAWTAQLLQERPGLFPNEGETWAVTSERLFSTRRFQQGALTYSWGEVLDILFDENRVAWVYAPLSRIRAIPDYESNILQADKFPNPSEWTEFSLQAEILWARPFGNERNRNKLVETTRHLKSADLQSVLAGSLGWIAANPDVPPYNPVSYTARIAWFSASSVWERRH